MSNPLRSKSGCWTCRLRKKKCDEIKPECKICTELSITCHGYGPKPDWMDNGEGERAMADSLKRTVRRTSRRIPGARVAVVTRKPVLKLAPRPSAAPVPAPNRPQVSDQSSFDQSSSRDASTDLSSPESVQVSACAISTEDSMLLMHYLDGVFPSQYPMYQPHLLWGGRGWLLALLLQTKSLHHAALAVSEYHRRLLLSEGGSQRCLVHTAVQQEKHLEACLAEVRQAMKSVDQFVQTAQPKDGLGTVTSIVQLVFFELFAGQDNAWKIHLNAAVDLYKQNFKDKPANLGLSKASTAILCGDPPLEVRANALQEVTAFTFMSGTIIWLDLISSITAGTAPKLLSCHGEAIASNSFVRLQDIMGCKNWVMGLIGRIAALQSHKKDGRLAGRLSCADFYQTITDIGSEIGAEMERGLTDEAFDEFDDLNVADGRPCALHNSRQDQITLVTRTFAYMATVLLHLIMYGFRNLEKLDAPMAATVRLLQTRIPCSLIPALVAPLFIIGCVARDPDQQELFQTVTASPPFQNILYKHRTGIPCLLKEVWARRQACMVSDWDDVLDLGQHHNILLL